MNTQPFSQTGQMMELQCECLFLWCIWWYALIMSPTHFRVNLHCILAWILLFWVRNSLTFDIQAGTECRFTLKRICDMIRIQSQMQQKDKNSQHSSIIWPVWVFLYKLHGCGDESHCFHLKCKFSFIPYHNHVGTMQIRVYLQHLRVKN